MTTSWLIDTNVLIYSYDQTQRLHSTSFSLLELAIAGRVQACVTHQNLLEFIAVATNPKRVRYPLSVDEALEKVAVYAMRFPLICPLPKTFLTFADLILRYSSLPENIFDKSS